MFYADEVAAFLWTLVTAALSLCLGVLLRYEHATGTVTLALWRWTRFSLPRGSSRS